MKKFFSDFRKFVTRGNILDLAVAVIIGGAFGRIVTSLVNDMLMPIISLMVGGRSVSDWKWVITPEVRDAAGVVITADSALMYGNFVQSIIDFLIVAVCIFVVVRVVTGLRHGVEHQKEEWTLHHEKKRMELAKRLRTEKKTRKQIKLALEEYDVHKANDLKAAEEAKRAEAEAARPRTSEELLAQILEVLKQDRAQGGGADKSMTDP